MADLDLLFIGTGNAFAPGGLCWNGFLLNGRFLFDAPPQALQSLNRASVDANEIDAVILSHHHGDHFLGLPFLFLQWKYSGRRRPITIMGPPETEALARSIGSAVYPDLFEAKYEVQWRECRPGESLTLQGLELDILEMQHDERLTGSLGFNGVAEGRRFSYTGDSAWCDSVLEMARHADVLISECASRDETVDVHMNLRDDMPRLRAAMKPDAALLLTHLGAGIEAKGLKRTKVARDLKAYRF